MGRYTTVTFTSGEITPGVPLDYDYNIGASAIDIHSISITASVPMGGCNVELYTSSNRTDLLYSTGSWVTSFLTPMLTVGDPAEETTPWNLRYDDEDLSGILHFTLYGDGQQKTFTITIEYETPYNSTIVMYPYNVKIYGATGNGTTDDTAAIDAAADAVQANGGGTLYFPKGTYKILSSPTAVQYPMCVFSALTGLKIIGDQATLAIDTDYSYPANWTAYIFLIAGCTNVEIDGFTVTGRAVSTGELGAQFAYIMNSGYHGCQNVRVTNIEIQGGCTNTIAVMSNTPGSELMDSKNIYIGNVSIKDCEYGPDFQHGGSEVVIENLMTENVTRSYFPYGVHDHKVQLISKNPKSNDCFIRGYGSYLENIEVDYTNVYSDQTSGMVCVTIQPYSDPATIRNIKIKMNIRNTSTSGYSFFMSADAYGIANVVENVEISGTVDGNLVMGIASGFTSTEIFRNFMFRNLRTTGQSSDSTLNLKSLKDNLALINVYSEKDIVLADQPAATSVSYINCHIDGVQVPVRFLGLPTSVSGLVTGDVYNSSGTLKIV